MLSSPRRTRFSSRHFQMRKPSPRAETSVISPTSAQVAPLKLPMSHIHVSVALFWLLIRTYHVAALARKPKAIPASRRVSIGTFPSTLETE